MLSLPTTLGGGGSSSSRHQHHGACPLSLLYHHECACLSPLLHQINADLIRHAPSPTMTKVTTVLPVHATNPRSTNGKGPRCMHLTLSPTPRMCIPPLHLWCKLLILGFHVSYHSIITLAHAPHPHFTSLSQTTCVPSPIHHQAACASSSIHQCHSACTSFHCLPRRTHDASPHPPHIAKVHASHPLSTNTDMSALYPPRRMPLILIQSWSTPVLIFTQFLRLSRCTTVAGATVTVCKL